MNDDYIIRQKSMDAEYRQAFNILSPELRAAMERSGIKAEADVTGLLGLRGSKLSVEKDAAEIAENSIEASVIVDMAAHVDTVPDLLREQFGFTTEMANKIHAWHNARVQHEVDQQRARLLFRMVGLLLMPGNVMLRVHALAHASRMSKEFELRSLRHSAQICNVTVEAVRKVAWKWVELLGFPPLEGAKSETAKKKYSEDKKTNHWRNQKVCKGQLLTKKH